MYHVILPSLYYLEWEKTDLQDQRCDSCRNKNTRLFGVFGADFSKRSNRNTFPCLDAFETRRVVVKRHTVKVVPLGMGENGLAGPTLRSLPKTGGFSVFFARISKRSNRNTFSCPDAFETRIVVVPRHTSKLVSLGMGENGLAGPTLRFLTV